MNNINLKKLVIILSFLLLLIIIISVIVNRNRKNETQFEEEEEQVVQEYDFNQTVDLDNQDEGTITREEVGTDNELAGSSIDKIYRQEDDKVYVDQYYGSDIVSKEWQNEGYALYISKPDFGEIDKFVLSPYSIRARYLEVKISDVISYINSLSGLGFTEVKIDRRDNKYDYYIYSAKKGDITATVNYEKGEMEISVF